jgi:hypothetical protein
MNACFYATYRILFEYIDRLNINRGITSEAIETLIKKKINTFLSVMGSYFDNYDYNRNGMWDIQQFKEFCSKSKLNCIYAEFETLKVKMPIYIRLENK